jgi:hypothetical protein
MLWEAVVDRAEHFVRPDDSTIDQDLDIAADAYGTKKLRTQILELRSLELRRLDLFRGEVLDLVWQLDPAGANRGRCFQDVSAQVVRMKSCTPLNMWGKGVRPKS